MAYKSILTILTDIDDVAPVLEAALPFVRAEGAHLEVLCLGVDRTQTGYYFAGATAVIHDETLQYARDEATAIEQAVRDRLAKTEIAWGVEALVAQTAMFQGQAPVLVLPGTEAPSQAPARVVVAWNESAEALTAVRRAMPLLLAADLVNILIIDPSRHEANAADPGSELSKMLTRKGAKVELSIVARTMPRISDVIARHVSDQNADLLVMGAYGHSRFREAILGGATRNLLEQASVPVLMAH